MIVPMDIRAEEPMHVADLALDVVDTPKNLITDLMHDVLLLKPVQSYHDRKTLIASKVSPQD